MDKKINTTNASSSRSFAQVVHQLNQDGGFQTVVLTSKEGLTIAASPPDCDNATIAAIVALLQRVSNDAQSMLGMADLDEVTIYDRNRVRLVCRYIVSENKSFILAVIVPPDRHYRRLMNWAVKQIAELLAK